MTHLGFAVLVQASVLCQASTSLQASESYAEAHRVTAETGRPMLVFVTAQWCPACQSMKREVLPQIRRRGLLRRVAFAVVNLDRERKLGQKLIRGGPVPQLLMYRKTPDGWRCSRLVGGQDAGKVERFIDQGLKRDELSRQEEGTPKPTA